jgi:hypothetical protein
MLAAILRFVWETHEQQPHGAFNPTTLDQGSHTYLIPGNSVAEVQANLTKLRDFILETFPHADRSSESSAGRGPVLFGPGAAQPNPPDLLRVRGGFADGGQS